MYSRVQLKEKKKFLKWFLQRYQMKRRESMWILNYLLNHDIVLNKTRFVEDVEHTPRGIRMATVGTEDEPFRFFKDGQVFDHPEQAFHEVRLNWHTDLYIELVFQDAILSPEYAAVLEDNPFSKWNDRIPKEVDQQVDEAIDYVYLQEQRQLLMDDIDKALETDNRDQFYTLAKELSALERQLENGVSS
ncbi:ReoY family proteolytic degradation factor [Alkalibacterium sp. MB6]|uniref:ReoY family proteolytic degradation factor n=1 Tax=Alkalibacterium sp. MB6 TaxID=2081965 RepID=UPI00137AD714|nr:ReoY family proteolytic degradation factor [Alkalibacterium sp. MB6]